MKNQILLVLLALSSLSVVACGRKAGGMDLDPELTPYVYEFLGESAAHGVDVDTSDLTVKYVSAEEIAYDGDQTKIGSCAREERSDVLKNGDFRRYTVKLVRINKTYIDFLKKYNDEPTVKINIKEAVFHELGHCLLGKKHNNETTTDASGGIRYASLMAATSQAQNSPSYVISNWQALVNNMFQK